MKSADAAMAETLYVSCCLRGGDVAGFTAHGRGPWQMTRLAEPAAVHTRGRSAQATPRGRERAHGARRPVNSIPASAGEPQGVAGEGRGSEEARGVPCTRRLAPLTLSVHRGMMDARRRGRRRGSGFDGGPRCTTISKGRLRLAANRSRLRAARCQIAPRRAVCRVANAALACWAAGGAGGGGRRRRTPSATASAANARQRRLALGASDGEAQTPRMSAWRIKMRRHARASASALARLNSAPVAPRRRAAEAGSRGTVPRTTARRAPTENCKSAHAARHGILGSFSPAVRENSGRVCLLARAPAAAAEAASAAGNAGQHCLQRDNCPYRPTKRLRPQCYGGGGGGGGCASAAAKANACRGPSSAPARGARVCSDAAHLLLRPARYTSSDVARPRQPRQAHRVAR